MSSNTNISVDGDNRGVIAGGDIKDANLINVGDIEGNYNAIGVGAQVIIHATSPTEERNRTRQAADLLLEEAIQAKVNDYLRRIDKSRIEQTTNPYKDLRAYQLTDASFFYGRDLAIGDLLDQIHKAPLTVLHAESGAGKSSLIQAGLMSRLLAAGHLPIYIRTRARSTSQSQEQSGLSQVIKAELMPEIESGVTDHDLELVQLNRKSLRDFLTDVSRILNLSTLYIFVDQFEDFFVDALMHPTLRRSFVEDLNSCRFDQSLDVRWILSLRKEFYSDLDIFGNGVFHNEYRLYGLTEEEAKVVVINPAQERGVTFEERLVDTIVQELKTMSIGRQNLIENMVGGSQTEETVAPPHVQLVCYKLFEELGASPKGKTITKVLYSQPRGQRKLPGAEGILTGHLQIVLSRLSPNDRQVASLILEELVTSQLRRIPHSKTELVAQLQRRRNNLEIRHIDRLLVSLVNERLLKTDQDDDVDNPTSVDTAIYELTHDYLLQEIDLDLTTRSRKAAQELLAQEVIAYQIDKRSRISEEKLRLIEEEEENLLFNQEAVTLMQMSREAIGRRRRTVQLGFGSAAITFIAALIFGVIAQNSSREANMAQITITAASETGTAIAIGQSTAEANATANLAIAAQRIRDGEATATAVSEDVDQMRAQAESIRLATESQSVLGQDPEKSKQMALAALREAHTVEAENALRIALHSIRLTNILTHEVEGITHPTFSYDGEFIAWVNQQQEIEVRKTSNGEIISIYLIDGSITRVTFSPTGEYLLLAGTEHGEVVIWDIVNDRRLISLRHESGEAITALAISYDGEYVLTGSLLDNTITLWSLPEGEPIRTHTIDTFIPSDFAISPDQSVIAIGEDDGDILVWDGFLEKELGAWSGHESRVESLVFSPDGTQLATGGTDSKASIWNSTTWSDTEPFKIEQLYQLDAHKSSIFHIAYNQNGSCLVTSSADSKAIVWNLNSTTTLFNIGEIVATLAGHTDVILQAAFLPLGSQHLIRPSQPCGNQLVTVGYDQTIRSWNIGATSELKTIVEHEGYVEAVQYSPSGAYLGTASDDNSAIIIETESFQVIRTIKHKGRVNDIQFSPNGNSVITASWDGTAKITKIDSGDERILKGHAGRVQKASFQQPNGEILATAGDDGVLILWDAAANTQLVSETIYAGPVNSITFSHDGSMISTSGAGGFVHLLDTNLQLWTYFEHGSSVSVYDVKFSPDDEYLVTAASDGFIRIWPTFDIVSVEVEAHPDSAVHEVGFGWVQDQLIMITVGSDGRTKLWEANMDEHVYTLLGMLPGHLDSINGVSFRNGQIATAGDDGTVRIYFADIRRYLTH